MKSYHFVKMAGLVTRLTQSASHWTRAAHVHRHTFSYATISQRTRQLQDGLLNGERWALAQAITLVESTNEKRQHQGQLLLSELQLINKQRQKPTMRIGKHVTIRRRLPTIAAPV